MQIIVFGASGFVGRHIFSHASNQRYEVLGTASRMGKSGLVVFDLLKQRVKDCIPPDFLNTDEPKFGVISIKYGPMDRYTNDPTESFQVEVEKTILLIEDLLLLGIKPVYLASSYVFDGNTGYYPEDYPHSPISRYGAHKSEVETYLRGKPRTTLTLRLDKMVGDSPDEAHLFSEWYQWAAQNRPITCIAGQIISPTFVGDVARGVLVSCQLGLSGIYNLVNPEIFPREELARQFCLNVGLRTEILSRTEEELGLLDRRPLRSYLDPSKFFQETGMSYTSMRQVFTRFKRNLDQVAIPPLPENT